MKPEKMTEALEQAAAQLGVQVRYETMTGEVSGAGGLCKVKGQWWVIIDRKVPPAERAATLTAALAQLDLTCTGNLRVEISVPEASAPQVVTPPGCLQPVDLGFAAGPAALTVTAKQVSRDSSVELGTVTCHAEVTPGQLIAAECEPNSAD